MLTNFKTVKQSIKRLKEMEAAIEDGSVERMSKKEGLQFQRELAKLQRGLGGIKTLDGIPDALFIVDVGYQKGAVFEARKLGVPVIGVVDSNNSPEGIAHVIPGNDDSSRAIRLYARGIADAVLEGRSQSIHDIVAAGSDEFVEVDDADGRASGQRSARPDREGASSPFFSGFEGWERGKMAEITAGLVKELRERTGLGMMECKRALEEVGGDLAKAEDLLRVRSGAKASKAAGRIASEGVIGAYLSSDRRLGALVEVNCETDFVAKNADFLAFARGLAEVIAQENPADVEALSRLSIAGENIETKR